MARDDDGDADNLRQAVQRSLAANPEIGRFADVLLGDGVAQHLSGADPVVLAADVREAYAFMADKPVGRHKIRVRASTGGDATLIEVLNDDMPFLVDSVVGEVQARQLRVHYVAHPIFATERGPGGQLIASGPAPAKASGVRQESLIVVAVDPMGADAASDLGRTLSDILGEVRSAVADWPAMVQRIERAIADVRGTAANPAERALVTDVLRWLLDGHFVLLGVEEMRFGSQDALESVAGSALGVLRKGDVAILRKAGRDIAITREMEAAAAPIAIAKASAQTRVHRRVHMDYVALKTYEPGAQTPGGEIRVVGLFTSKAYTASARTIPLLREKIEAVLAGSGYPPDSHAAKALVNILDTFPRDELFQISTTDLAAAAQGILDLEMRPRVRLFTRNDRYGRFVSALLYAPRDRWTTAVRERIGALLSDAARGRIASFQPFFLEGPLLRAHFIVATREGEVATLDVPALEARITEIMRTFDDRLGEAASAFGTKAAAIASRYGGAFPPDYAETMSAARAIEDIRRIERLAETNDPVAIDFYRDEGDGRRVYAAVSRFGEPIRLSERVPVLENFGFSVIDERSYALDPRIGGTNRRVALHHMQLETGDGQPIELSAHDDRLEDAFRAVYRGAAENDVFNRLVIKAGANWREAALMRAYGAYLRQLNAPFGLRYIGDTIVRHAGVARDIVELFHLKFDPDHRAGSMEARKAASESVRARIDGALAHVPSLDEDRILRLYLSLVDATLRTNFYQIDADGQPPELIALKFDTKAIEAAPSPRPYREIWVYSPRVEGVHLRFGPIARGGIRWSDRAGDFRTEVLGLVKAQLVKNAVIVPSGAKGGFVPKQMPRSGARDEVMKEGIAAYRLFISSLLDITDNIVDGVLVPPPRCIRHDGDDPYLVVAADKGTATFSDIANDISARRGHWLGDAFASGGSVGYDHKKMAITARGGWECVKRHFREMDIDIQTTPFFVAGVGDMSGDVFGNGMLLSPAIRLVAAFDHRDIFIDPDPDPAVSFAERKRLFDLPRSSWQDYDKSRLSRGGGVFSRSAKRIALTPEVRALLDIEAEHATPQEIMRAILKARVDLLWFGGIGTYVRASGETDDQVGDRANDAIRVTAGEVGAKVIGEGANLGLTQRGRVELAERGVRLNTDFIDNSAGVNSSDLEVNIKIAVGRLDRSGELAGERRSAFLAAMTDDVADRCLVNNYEQSLALSLVERRSAPETRDLIALMHDLERRDLLDRKLEALPGDTDLLARQKAGRPLTRPELALLLSYAKIGLTDDLLDSALPDAPHAASLLGAYMPRKLRETYPAEIEAHRLRREIIATAITNALLNRAGPTAAVVLSAESGRKPADVASAYLLAADAYDFDGLWRDIGATDGVIRGALQLELYGKAQAQLRAVLRSLLRDPRALDEPAAIGQVVREARAALADLGAWPAATRRAIEGETTRLVSAGLSAGLASRLAMLPLTADALALARLSGEAKRPVGEAAQAYALVGDQLRVADLRAKAAGVPGTDPFDAQAVSQALAQIARAQSQLASRVLLAGHGGAEARLEGHDYDAVKSVLDQIAGDDSVSVSRVVVAANRLAELAGKPIGS